MSEQTPANPEQHMLPEYERLEALPTANEAEPLRKGEADPLKLQEARDSVNKIERQDDNPTDILKAAERTQETSQPAYINHELKSITLRREMQQLRRKLRPTERTLSRVIHQPTVRVVSDVAGKSITRPSGLLGGGVVAFFGTACYYYLSKHIGFTYNYLIFILLFVGGFILGLVLEIIIWTITTRYKHN